MYISALAVTALVMGLAILVLNINKRAEKELERVQRELERVQSYLFDDDDEDKPDEKP